MKNLKPLKNAHTPNTKYGMGDYYGSGIKNPIGKIIDSTVGFTPLSPKKLKNPPKNLA